MSFKGPRAGSLAQRVYQFLSANPDEELTRSDIAAKFDIEPASVDKALSTAIINGWIKRERSEDSTFVWRLGRGIDIDAVHQQPAPVEKPESRGFSCALFNDGRLVLEASGGDLQLTTAESHALIRYLARMGQEITCPTP